MRDHPKNGLRRRLARGGLILCACVLGCVALLDRRGLNVSAQVRRASRSVSQNARYTQFPHNAKAHRIECSSCHKFPTSNWNKVRAKETAFPDVTEYPDHESCVGCHKPQFFKGARPPICTICHVNPSPRGGPRHPFPNPREIFDGSAKGRTATSDFSIRFPHATHIEIVSGVRSTSPFRLARFERGRRAGEESCAVCHTTVDPQGDGSEEYVTKPPASNGDAYWLKKGTFKSIPTGHTTCFTCHSADTGILPAQKDCATCHSLKPPVPPADMDVAAAGRMGLKTKSTLDLWSRRISAGTFRHEWFSHAELSCSTCHNVAKMNTVEAVSRKVPVSACATCHATASLDDGGAINFEVEARKKDKSFQCAKCHVVYGKGTVPQSHLDAITAAGGKQ